MPLGLLRSHPQSLLFIEPVDTLVINLPAFSLQHDVKTPISHRRSYTNFWRHPFATLVKPLHLNIPELYIVSKNGTPFVVFL